MYSIACDSYSTQEGVQWSGDQVLVILEKLNYGDINLFPGLFKIFTEAITMWDFCMF